MSAQAATSPGRRLRDALRSDTPVIAPGAFNPLLARLIERAGFPADLCRRQRHLLVVYGRPDMGLSTMTEIRDVVRNIAGAASIPVLGDIDQGFGDLLGGVAKRAGVRGGGPGGRAHRGRGRGEQARPGLHADPGRPLLREAAGCARGPD